MSNWPENIKKVPHKFLNDQEFVKKTVQQINKDLPVIVKPISEDLTADNVVEQLYLRIDFLLKEHKEKIPQFLYQIDLPEKVVKKLFETDFNALSEKLTKMILEREAQKVYLKLKWSDAT